MPAPLARAPHGRIRLSQDSFPISAREREEIARECRNNPVALSPKRAEPKSGFSDPQKFPVVESDRIKQLRRQIAVKAAIMQAFRRDPNPPTYLTVERAPADRVLTPAPRPPHAPASYPSPRPLVDEVQLEQSSEAHADYVIKELEKNAARALAKAQYLRALRK